MTYAVHRMEEEGRRRGGRRGAGAVGFLAGLNEDDEYEDHEDDVPIGAHDPNRPAQQHRSLMDGRAGQKDQGKEKVTLATGYPVSGPAVNPNTPRGREPKRGGRGAFELQMDNATLLGRRQNAHRHNAVETVR